MNQSYDPFRDYFELGRFVRERRRRATLTQHQLADLTGVGYRFIVELERGKPTLRLDKVNQVLRAFGSRLGPVGLPRDATPPQDEPTMP